MLKNCYKTAESVSCGHPDSYMDAVVNHILDAYLEQDPNTRFALDGVVKNKFVTLGGEITSTAKVDIPAVAREVTELIGYDFTPEVTLHVYEQSPDIALGTNDEVQGAGDQGTITGYACTGNPRMMPLEKALADELIRVMYINKRGEYDFIKPDMKSQITIYYNEEGLPILDTVVFACQHTTAADHGALLPILKDAIQEACDRLEVSNNEEAKIILNGTGLFIIGGPEADSGEVGRKIVVDAYGVSVPVGGGTYNGKDATKVDRSAAYMSRYVAKTIVNAGLADECLITVSYVIGHKDPVSIDYDFKGTEHFNKELIAKACNELFSFKPADIIKRLELTNPIFGPASIVSHFGLKFKGSLTGDSYVRIPWEDVEESTTQLLDALKEHGFHRVTYKGGE